MDKDASLDMLKDKVIGVIGYGNQGRSQALNLRDSGLSVIVGNIKDSAWDLAVSDGFTVKSISETAKESDVILLLIPDEVAPRVTESNILPYLSKGKVLDFASGYNITYGFIKPPKDVDVILVAPRMIGKGVRDLFLQNRGFPVLVGVEQDASGKAWDYALAISKGIGAFLPGGCAVESSFYEETLVDLFSEHSWAGAMLYLLQTCYEVLIEEGVSPEVAILELYASGELGEIGNAIAQFGLWKQLVLHSHTSQYGHMTRGKKYITEETKRIMKEAIEEIKDGRFAREWGLEQAMGLPSFNRLWKLRLSHPICEEEDKLYKILGRR
ncbi:MAG: ketol-acid reductoisomerase [bacterium]